MGEHEERSAELRRLLTRALAEAGADDQGVTTGVGELHVGPRRKRRTPTQIMQWAQSNAEAAWSMIEDPEGDMAPAVELYVRDRVITIGVPGAMLTHPLILDAFYDGVILKAVAHVKPDTAMVASSVWALPQRNDPDYDDPAPGVYPLDHPERREGLVVEVITRHTQVAAFCEILRSENAAPTLAPPWDDAPGTAHGYKIHTTMQDA